MKEAFPYFLFLSLFLLLAPSPGLCTKKINLIRVCIFPLQPINFLDENQVSKGIYPDILRHVAHKEDWTLQYVPGSWANCLDWLQQEEIDLMTTIAYTPERARVMDFSKESVVNIWGQVFVHPDSKIDTILDLNGSTVAVMRKDINGVNFQKTASDLGVKCTLVELATHAEVFQAVKEGKARAGVAPQFFGLQQGRQFGLVATPILFSPFSIYFSAKKGRHNETLRKIDTYLTKWKKDPESAYYDSLSYWMGGNKYEKIIIPKWLLTSFAAAAVLVFFLFLMNRALKSQVRMRTQELHNSEKQYRELVQSASSVILRWDKEGHILFMNSFGLDLFGYDEGEIIGRNLLDTIVPASEQSSVKLRKMMENILVLPDKYDIDVVENVCKDGHKVFVQWSNRAIVNERGEIEEVLSVGTDVTEQKSLEAELFQAQKMEAVGTLAGGIAHDFNNILSAIFGHVELAKIVDTVSPKVEEHLDGVLKASVRAKNLVEQILTYSRKVESEKTPLQPSVLLKETVQLIRSSIPTTIEVKVNIVSENKILIDPTQFHQIIMNLCTNAFHAMEETGGILGISLKDIYVNQNHISSSELDFGPGEFMQVEISDSGTGMDQEMLQKIFEPYFTTKEQGKGTGLGLAVVHGIVKQHNGHITVYSKPNVGTTFHIYFPLVKSLDGESALNSFQREPGGYDLVITDMTMPGLTGAKLIKEIFQINPDTPIILCTGYSELINREKSMNLGVADFLQKPVMMNTLLRSVRKTLDEKVV